MSYDIYFVKDGITCQLPFTMDRLELLLAQGIRSVYQ